MENGLDFNCLEIQVGTHRFAFRSSQKQYPRRLTIKNLSWGVKIVNTAARMESTGLRDKIQISQETADLLIAAGKAHWFFRRDGLVKAKGKGELQTYWLTSGGTGGRRLSMGSVSSSVSGGPRRASIGGPIQRRGSAGGANGGGARRYSIGRRKSIGTTRTLSQRHGLTSRTPSQKIVTTDNSDDHNIMSRLEANVTDDNDADSDASGNDNPTALPDTFSPLSLGENPILRMGAVLSERQQRLVDWNCELIQQLLRQIVARRNFMKNTSRLMTLPFNTINNAMAELGELPKLGERFLSGANPMPLDEVVEVINLPEFDVAAYHGTADAKQIQLDAVVVQQIRRYVTILASRYR